MRHLTSSNNTTRIHALHNRFSYLLGTCTSTISSNQTLTTQQPRTRAHPTDHNPNYILSRICTWATKCLPTNSLSISRAPMGSKWKLVCSFAIDLPPPPIFANIRSYCRTWGWREVDFDQKHVGGSWRWDTGRNYSYFERKVFDTLFQVKDTLTSNVQVNEAVLRKVILWCEHHKNDPPASSEDDSDSRKKTTDIDEWDQKFMQVDQEMLFEIILVGPRFLVALPELTVLFI